MRIVIAPDGSVGDVHPMLLLAERLLAMGHELLFCAPPDFREDAESRGIPFHAVGTPVRPYLKRIADELHRGGLGFVREANRYSLLAMDAQYAALPELARDADLIIGVGVQFGARAASLVNKIPYLCIVYCPAVLPSDEHAPFTIENQRMPRIVNRLAWAMTHLFYTGVFRGELNRRNATLGLPAVHLRETHRYLTGDHVVLAADETLAPRPRRTSVGVTQIPALVGVNRSPLPDHVKNFLAEGEAPVFIGFGSMPDPDPRATAEHIFAAVEKLGCRAIVGTGWAALSSHRPSSKILVVDSLSHAALFPQCAAVVHHGGAGTTTTTFRAGVPHLVVPHILDQFYFAKRVEDLGLGPQSVSKRNLTSELLRKRIDEAVSNKTFGARARDLAARPRLSLDEGIERALALATRLPAK